MLSVSLRIPSFFILDNGLLYFLVREIHFAIIQLTTSDRFIFKIIASWHVDGEMVETEADFIFLGSKISADGDCSHEIKRRLLLGRKVMTNLDNILKSRHYFINRGPSSQGYGFSSGHVCM